MKTLFVGGEHEVRCDGTYHWVYPADTKRFLKGCCDCLNIPGSAKPAFTTQHYEAIAAVLRSYDRSSDERPPQPSLLDRLCGMFEADNPQFNREKFREACFKEAALRCPCGSNASPGHQCWP